MIHTIAEACVWPTATPQQRRHTKSGGTYQKPNVRRAERFWAQFGKRHAPQQQFDRPCHVAVTLFRNKGCGAHLTEDKPDRDNLLKIILDGLTKGGWWADDRVAHPSCEAIDCNIDGVMIRAETDVYDSHAQTEYIRFIDILKGNSNERETDIV